MSPPEALDLPADAIITIAHQHLPVASLSVFFPRKSGEAILIFGNWPVGPSNQRVLALDCAAGEPLQEQSNRDLGFLA